MRGPGHGSWVETSRGPDGQRARRLRFPSVRPRVLTSDGARLTVPSLSRGTSPVQPRGIEVPRSTSSQRAPFEFSVPDRLSLPKSPPPKPNRHRLAPPFGSGLVLRFDAPGFLKDRNDVATEGSRAGHKRGEFTPERGWSRCEQHETDNTEPKGGGEFIYGRPHTCGSPTTHQFLRTEWCPPTR